MWMCIHINELNKPSQLYTIVHKFKQKQAEFIRVWIV